MQISNYFRTFAQNFNTNPMNKYLLIYLTGVAVSAFICLILTLLKKELRISDIISVLLNVICSWATLISLMGIVLNKVLNMKGKNLLIWKKSSEASKAKIIHKKH